MRESRVPWADVAKGICILLVVVHHVVGKHQPLVLELLAVTSPVGDAWTVLDAAFKPMRMPLFFMLSGMFAAGAVRRPWPTVVGRKVLTPYWVYLAWLTVHLTVFALAATRIETHRPVDLWGAASHLLVAATGLWYLYALAVYFVLAKLLLRLRTPVVLSGAAMLSASVSYLPVQGVNRMAILQCLVFFLAGVHLPHLLRNLPRLGSWQVAGLVTGYGGVAALAFSVDAARSVTLLVLAPFAVLLGAQAAMRLAERPLVGDALAALGRRTLPVYVLHMPLLGLAHQLLPDAATPLGPPTGIAPLTPSAPLASTVVAVLYPAVAAAVLIGLCLLLHAGAVRTPLVHLFAPPQRLVDRVEAALRGPSSPAPRSPRVRSAAPGPPRSS